MQLSGTSPCFVYIASHRGCTRKSYPQLVAEYLDGGATASVVRRFTAYFILCIYCQQLCIAQQPLLGASWVRSDFSMAAAGSIGSRYDRQQQAALYQPLLSAQLTELQEYELQIQALRLRGTLQDKQNADQLEVQASGFRIAQAAMERSQNEMRAASARMAPNTATSQPENPAPLKRSSLDRGVGLKELGIKELTTVGHSKRILAITTQNSPAMTTVQPKATNGKATDTSRLGLTINVRLATGLSTRSPHRVSTENIRRNSGGRTKSHWRYG